MKYLHTMLRISDKETSLNFFVNALGLKEVRTIDVEEGRFSLIFLAAEGNEESQIELTHNWDGDDLGNGSRNFGHLAYEVDNIYEVCEKLQDKGVTINRPPRDGRMAFVKSPDNISIEILQRGDALEPIEPWLSMENNGSW
jgi:lactoylglutathione lyase